LTISDSLEGYNKKWDEVMTTSGGCYDGRPMRYYTFNGRETTSEMGFHEGYV
jgi:hypothetical protein